MKEGDLKKSIDLETWKSMQKTFNSVLRCPLLTTDHEGREIFFSKEAPSICQIMISKGNDLCETHYKSQFEELQSTQQEIKASICPVGLLTISAPIKINQRCLGAVHCTSIRRDEGLRHSKNLSSQLGMKEEEIDLLYKEIKKTNETEIDKAGSLLYVLSNTAPPLASNKLLAEKKLNEMLVINRVSSMVNTSLDLAEALNYVMKFMTQALKAENCTIVILDQQGLILERYVYKTELYDTRALHMIENCMIKSVQEDRRVRIVHSIKDKLKLDKNTKISKAMITLPLYVRNKLLGIISLYGESADKLKEEDLRFLSTIGNQVAIAIVNAQQYTQIRELAIRDKLTGLYNRLHFIEMIDKEIKRSAWNHKSISFIMMDIDDFKHYNDTHGHLRGDKLLNAMAGVLNYSVRETDVVGRYGGEEFVVILPETDYNEGLRVAERIRRNVSNHPFEFAESQPLGFVSMSLGLITSSNPTITTEQLIHEADLLLYKAKRNGKNRVEKGICIPEKRGITGRGELRHDI